MLGHVQDAVHSLQPPIQPDWEMLLIELSRSAHRGCALGEREQRQPPRAVIFVSNMHLADQLSNYGNVVHRLYLLNHAVLSERLFDPLGEYAFNAHLHCPLVNSFRIQNPICRVLELQKD